MTQTDLLADLDGLDAAAMQAGLAGRVAEFAGALRASRLVLYAGANVLTPALRATFDPDLSFMPAMGPADDKEQPGSDFAASLETLAARLAASVFEAAWADCRLPSCTIANLAVFGAFAKAGDVVLTPAATDGGHLSQRRGGTPSLFGLDARDLPFDAARQRLDADRAAALIREARPAIVMLGRSVVLGPDDLLPVVAAARETGAVTVYDAAHVAGLIAGGAFPNPLAAGIDLLTMSTYKTLAGPTGAIVLGRDSRHGERLRRLVDGALLANADAARLAPLAGVLTEFRDGSCYAHDVVASATALKRALAQEGLEPLLPDAEAASHQVVLPVGALDETIRAMTALEGANILVGRCPVPGRPGQHGLRFGTQFATRIGLAAPALIAAAPAIAAVLREAAASAETLPRDHPALAAGRAIVEAALGSCPACSQRTN